MRRKSDPARELHTKVQFEGLTKVQLLALGFRQWDESGLMLVPRELVELLGTGTILHGIDGKLVRVGLDPIDLDVRYGCIAFGVYPVGGA